MNARMTMLAVALALGATGAHADPESNGPNAVELSAGTGVYHTTTYGGSRGLTTALPSAPLAAAASAGQVDVGMAPPAGGTTDRR